MREVLSFRTKKDRSLELTSVYHECAPGRRKLAVKVVDIFGNDTMTIVDGMSGGCVAVARIDQSPAKGAHRKGGGACMIQIKDIGHDFA